MIVNSRLFMRPAKAYRPPINIEISIILFIIFGIFKIENSKAVYSVKFDLPILLDWLRYSNKRKIELVINITTNILVTMFFARYLLITVNFLLDSIRYSIFYSNAEYH